MIRQDPPRSRTGNGVVPIVAFLAIFGLTLVLFFLQLDRSPDPASGAPPPTPAGAPGVAPHPESMPLNDSFQQRLSDLQAALEADPADTVALSELSGIWLTAHQPERGLALSRQWTEVAPESVSAWLQLVTAYGVLERWDEAFQANVRLLELAPDHHLGMLNMGTIQANRQELEEARRWWSRVVEEAPGTSEAQAAAESLSQLGGGGKP
jgi:tetratricopeptide (TPR) repeat protein